MIYACTKSCFIKFGLIFNNISNLLIITLYTLKYYINNLKLYIFFQIIIISY